VDAELEKMWTRLIELAVEINDASPVVDKLKFTYQAACRAGDAVSHLRSMLKTQQEHMRIAEEIQRQLYGKAQK
jgi:hypothetical protein